LWGLPSTPKAVVAAPPVVVAALPNVPSVAFPDLLNRNSLFDNLLTPDLASSFSPSYLSAGRDYSQTSIITANNHVSTVTPVAVDEPPTLTLLGFAVLVWIIMRSRGRNV
jgi:hypothetical protein